MRNINILPKIKQLVTSVDATAQVYLYGSRAKGTERKDSDWDILILLKNDKITPELESRFTYPLYDLEFDTGEIISPTVYSLNDWNTKYRQTSFYQNVMKTGKPI